MSDNLFNLALNVTKHMRMYFWTNYDTLYIRNVYRISSAFPFKMGELLYDDVPILHIHGLSKVIVCRPMHAYCSFVEYLCLHVYFSLILDTAIITLYALMVQLISIFVLLKSIVKSSIVTTFFF